MGTTGTFVKPVILGSAFVLMVGSVATAGAAVATSPTGSSARVAAPIVKGVVADGSGMTLVALQPSGRAKKVKLGTAGSFKFAASAIVAGTTLHLINSDGRYFGPLVLRGNGPQGRLAGSKLVFTQFSGVVPTARPTVQRVLGLGAFKKQAGYASPVAIAAAKYVRATKAAFGTLAVSGRPVGAGKLGRVVVANAGVLAEPSRSGNDKDRDGLPGAFDIDDDGDLRLDNVDRSPRSGNLRSVATQDVGSEGIRLFSNYKATQPDFSDVINANVAIPTTEQIDESVRTKTSLAIQSLPGGALTCTGQLYCPASLDISTPGFTGDIQWQPGIQYPSLTAAQINPGDAFVATANGTTYPGVLNFIFKTTPALKSYALVSEGTVGPPTEVNWSGIGPKAGSSNSRIAVDPGSGQKLRLTFWRPQRAAVGDEQNLGGFVDIGGLTYKADAHPGFCAATAVPGDGTTTVVDGGSTVVRDDSADAVPANSRTISMDIDLNNCPQNSTVEDIDIQAVSSFGDNAAQKIFVDRS